MHRWHGELDRTHSEAIFLRGIGAADLDAMGWARGHTPEDARFLVAPRGSWYSDRTTEWFPSLAERINVATPQGYEWVEREFGRRALLHDQARRCTNSGASCLEELAQVTGFNYVYLPSGCCEPLASSLRRSARYDVLYDESGALIARRK